MTKIELISILLGANGLWKLAELYFKNRSDKKKRFAEMTNLNAQTNNLMLENWIEWSARLENRVKELESKLEQMTIEGVKKDELLLKKDRQITSLKQENELLKTENETLKLKVDEYRKNH